MRALFLLLVIGAALVGAPDAGARFTAGKLVGPGPTPLGPPASRFAFDGSKASRPSRAPGRSPIPPRQGSVEVSGTHVSVTGDLLGTRPRDLGARLEALRPVQP